MTSQTNNEREAFEKTFPDLQQAKEFKEWIKREYPFDDIDAFSGTLAWKSWQVATARQEARIAKLENEVLRLSFGWNQSNQGSLILEQKLAIAVEVLESIVANVSDAWVNKAAYEALTKIKDMK